MLSVKQGHLTLKTTPSLSNSGSKRPWITPCASGAGGGHRLGPIEQDRVYLAFLCRSYTSACACFAAAMSSG